MEVQLINKVRIQLQTEQLNIIVGYCYHLFNVIVYY